MLANVPFYENPLTVPLALKGSNKLNYANWDTYPDRGGLPARRAIALVLQWQ